MTAISSDDLARVATLGKTILVYRDLEHEEVRRALVAIATRAIDLDGVAQLLTATFLPVNQSIEEARRSLDEVLFRHQMFAKSRAHTAWRMRRLRERARGRSDAGEADIGPGEDAVDLTGEESES